MHLSPVDKDHIIQMCEYQFWIDMDLELDKCGENHTKLARTVFYYL